MAILSEAERYAIWGEFMSDASAKSPPELIGGTMNKHDLRDVVDAIDQWIEDNQASFNQALPEPGRSQLTTKQKVRLFMFIARRRYEVS
jgi:hypothetical protein